MKKIFIISSVIIIGLMLTGCGKEDKKSVLKKFEKKIKEVNGYQMEAEMELINNEDSYKYDVTVSYKKENNYRVSLRNKTNNHEQIILKNEEGVYVLSPRLNKSFKFQSKWPFNNSQSYIVQSVLNDLKSDSNIIMKKKNNNYVFKSTVNYKNNANLKYQEVVLDKNYQIKSVSVFDNKDIAQIKVDFKVVDMKAKFDDDYFELEENMEMSKVDEQIQKESKQLEEAIYPMYLPSGTYLENEKMVELDEGSRIILTFAGESSFMLVEEKVNKNDELSVIPTSGDIDLFADGIAIIGETSVSWTSNDIEYYLVSSDISKEELLNVAKSMSLMPVSK